MEKIGRRDFLKLNMFATGELFRMGLRNKQNSLILTPNCLTGKVLRGFASYYSESGCLGCSVNEVMADGNRFNEENMTLAYNVGPLDRWVLVTNIKKRISRFAKVTDRGGFDQPPYNRIADLSKGLMEEIGGEGITEVTIAETNLGSLNC